MSELKKRDELVNDSVHKISKVMDRFNQRLTLRNLRLAERYVNGELNILPYFTLINEGGINENFIACFQRFQRPWLDGETFKGNVAFFRKQSSNAFAIDRVIPNVDSSQDHAGGEDQAML